MREEQEQFLRTMVHVQATLSENFKTDGLVLVSKNPTIKNGVLIVGKYPDCNFCGEFLQHGYTTEHLSFFDERSVFFCSTCLPEESKAVGSLFEVIEYLALKAYAKDLQKGTFESSMAYIYYQVLRTPDVLSRIGALNLTHAQAIVLRESIATLRQACVDLLKTNSVRLEDGTGSKQYIAYNLNDWYYLMQKFDGCRILADRDGTEDNMYLAGLLGTLLHFPRIESGALWVVEVPENLVKYLRLNGSGLLKSTRFPTEEELSTAQALISDGMFIKDAVETSMVL